MNNLTKQQLKDLIKILIENEEKYKNEISLLNLKINQISRPVSDEDLLKMYKDKWLNDPDNYE